MPVNGQMNKTRTAKSKGKGLKLKWWYVLPVIAIVAVAGYLVIRYSQAGRSVALRGRAGTYNRDGKSLKRVGEGLPVTATVGVVGQENNAADGTRINGADVCAKVYLSNFFNKPLNGTLKVQPYLYTNTGGAGRLGAALSNYGNPAAPSIDTSSVFGPYKSTTAPLTKRFTGKNQYVTTCIKVPKTNTPTRRNFQPVYADVTVSGDLSGPDAAIKYPIAVERIWIKY